ncbi:hypothetical protein P2I54_14165 [Mannheimia haemolytica]|nr:hypothetical protein [Mannheimia haemolytica]
MSYDANDALNEIEEALSELERVAEDRQMSPETLRWTADHPSSSYGMGALLRGKSGEILDGKSFAAMVHAFGAWIETDSEDTSRRVHNALVTAATGTEESVKVAKE